MWIYFTILTVGALCLIGGIAKCWSISRRPSTNRKCVLALMLLLFAWLLSLFRASLSIVFPVPEVVDLVFTLAAFAITMAAAVLAVVGLGEYSQGKRFIHGRAQAIWTLCLSAVILASTFYSVSRARHKNRLPSTYMANGVPNTYECVKTVRDFGICVPSARHTLLCCWCESSARKLLHR
jgi:hypothetical protein